MPRSARDRTPAPIAYYYPPPASPYAQTIAPRAHGAVAQVPHARPGVNAQKVAYVGPGRMYQEDYNHAYLQYSEWPSFPDSKPPPRHDTLLPDELWFQIFAFLTGQALKSFSLVSTYFRKSCQRALFTRHVGLASPVSARSSKWQEWHDYQLGKFMSIYKHPSVIARRVDSSFIIGSSYLSLPSDHPSRCETTLQTMSMFYAVIRLCRSLREITIAKMNIDDHMLSQFLEGEGGSRLRDLVLDDCDITTDRPLKMPIRNLTVKISDARRGQINPRRRGLALFDTATIKTIDLTGHTFIRAFLSDPHHMQRLRKIKITYPYPQQSGSSSVEWAKEGGRLVSLLWRCPAVREVEIDTSGVLVGLPLMPNDISRFTPPALPLLKFAGPPDMAFCFGRSRHLVQLDVLGYLEVTHLTQLLGLLTPSLQRLKFTTLPGDLTFSLSALRNLRLRHLEVLLVRASSSTGHPLPRLHTRAVHLMNVHSVRSSTELLQFIGMTSHMDQPLGFQLQAASASVQGVLYSSFMGEIRLPKSITNLTIRLNGPCNSSYDEAAWMELARLGLQYYNGLRHGAVYIAPTSTTLPRPGAEPQYQDLTGLGIDRMAEDMMTQMYESSQCYYF